MVKKPIFNPFGIGLWGLCLLPTYPPTRSRASQLIVEVYFRQLIELCLTNCFGVTDIQSLRDWSMSDLVFYRHIIPTGWIPYQQTGEVYFRSCIELFLTHFWGYRYLSLRMVLWVFCFLSTYDPYRMDIRSAKLVRCISGSVLSYCLTDLRLPIFNPFRLVYECFVFYRHMIPIGWIPDRQNWCGVLP